MCTAVTYRTKSHYFGRNLDWEHPFGEKIVITPRNFPLEFCRKETMRQHYAMIGMAAVMEGTPLYFEATNEKGLSMAGLNFSGNADYKEEIAGKDNIAPYEIISWLLGQCETVHEARNLLEQMNLVSIPFRKSVPLATLHWMVSDREKSIVVESVKEGLNIYENPIEVLTNNPTFDKQMLHLSRYMHVSSEEPVNRFSSEWEPEVYSRGMGGIGLPGDWSSDSRFVRAAFTKMNAVSGDSEQESVSQFFHILDSVALVRGCVKIGDNDYDITSYQSCCNTDQGIYYYKTYENNQITGIDMHAENLEGNRLITYPQIQKQQIQMQNALRVSAVPSERC